MNFIDISSPAFHKAIAAFLRENLVIEIEKEPCYDYSDDHKTQSFSVKLGLNVEGSLKPEIISSSSFYVD